MKSPKLAKKIAKGIVDFSANHYGLTGAEHFSDDEKRQDCNHDMYEFLKYVFGSTDWIKFKYITKSKNKRDKWFNSRFKEEAAWLIMGGELPDQDLISIKIPEVLKDLLGDGLPGSIDLDRDMKFEKPHGGSITLMDDDIDDLITEFKSKNNL